MTKYRIYYPFTGHAYSEIMAETEQEARDKFNGGNWDKNSFPEEKTYLKSWKPIHSETTGEKYEITKIVKTEKL